MDEWRRSGQIPAFGNWEQANDLPITQYFESARQAGLLNNNNNRHRNSSGEYMCGDLYATSHSHNLLPPPRKTRMKEKRGQHVVVSNKELKKQAGHGGKVCDVTQPQRKQMQQQQRQHNNNHPPYSIYNVGKVTKNNNISVPVPVSVPVPTTRRDLPRPPKPVDEDLYKIPPHLLQSSKRKKRAGFFSCLVPDCAS